MDLSFQPDRRRSAQVRVHPAHGDAVDAHLGRQLVGELVDQAAGSELGRGVDGAAAGRWKDALDRVITIDPRLFDQFPPGRLDGQEVALDVDGEQLVEASPSSCRRAG